MSPAITPFLSPLFLWLILFFVAVAVNLGFCYGPLNGTTTPRCIHSEREALLEFKQHLTDASNRLASWTASDANCCSWYGVTCDASTSHVLRLHLRSLSFLEYSSGFVTYAYEETYAAYEKTLLGGNMSSALVRLKKLRYLDLSLNDFGGIRIPAFIGSIGSLRYLNLSGAGFGGMIPPQLGNLSNLRYLNLRSHHNYKLEFEGGIPMSFQNVCNLRELDLSGVKLGQDIRQVFGILSSNLHLCVSNKLEALWLRGCQIFGNFNIIDEYLGLFENLAILFLSNNSISGQIPMSLRRLHKLEELYIDDNLLEGDVSEAHFHNLTSLKFFVASGNELKLQVGSNWIPPFDQLQILRVGSWHVGPQFPKWLRSFKSLRHLDLSNSRISDSIPLWFWKLPNSFFSLNLSHNQIHGVIPNMVRMERSSWIDLSSNHFQGPLPHVSPDLGALDLSNNSFSGSISNFLCHNIHLQKHMQVMHLEANLLSGELPNCWKSWRSLMAINLSRNKFNGSIPESIGTLS